MSTHQATSRKDQDVEVAYQVQVRAGITGMLVGITIGVGLVALGHRSWPAFRQQTLPFKAFLVSGCTMSGLVINAEHALLKFQAVKRVQEDAARNEARTELAKLGIVGTETAIAKWRDAKDARERAGAVTLQLA